MERAPKGNYTPEFRAESVKFVEVNGMSVARVAKQLSMPKSGLDYWVRAAREVKLTDHFLDTAEIVTGGRRDRPNYPLEFKRRLAVEACEPGVSVAKLVLLYGLNTNMVFKWRRQYRAGQFDTHSDTKAVRAKPLFLPVPAGPVASKPRAIKAAYQFLVQRLSQDNPSEPIQNQS